MSLELFISAFVLGLLTPLGAICVLPLYPGFLAYLANQGEKKRSILSMGILVSLGVILFMLLLGLIFTTILQVSLTNVIGVISPIAFGILAAISLLLIFNVDFGKYIPQFAAPVSKSPLLTAFLYGFFFGAIVVPCNPAFIAALFARTLVMSNFVVNLLSFVLFGLGIAAPLLLFAIISSASSSNVINFLIKYRRPINLIAGLFMLGVSLYYLIFVFRIFG